MKCEKNEVSQNVNNAMLQHKNDYLVYSFFSDMLISYPAGIDSQSLDGRRNL